MINTRAPLSTLMPEVAERIAAGEVIERPVSVVKELLENALDAHASSIRVEIRGGGLELLRIVDNGDGILPDDLTRLCHRHTTSKLRQVEDLEQLQSLGFRGEALASIAAVGEIEIWSQAVEIPAEERPAHWLTWRGGEQTEQGLRARTQGTTVTVRDLFYNVPARLKFMRGVRIENGAILQLIRRYALGYPQTRFHLLLNGHSALQTSGSGQIATALAEIYQLAVQTLLVPIIETGDYYRLHGYVGTRTLAQPNRQHIIVFVNGRLVQLKSIQEHLEKAYRSLLPRGKHPLAVLMLEIPPEDLDVNIHPTKSEIRLLNESMISMVCAQAVRQILERSPEIPETPAFHDTFSVVQQRLPGPRRRGLRVAEQGSEYQWKSSELLPEQDPQLVSQLLSQLRPLAQFQETVILAEARNGSLYLIDQHRAHERILYEQLCSRHLVEEGENEQAGHLLLEPVVIEMKPEQADLLESRLPLLSELGLECERFGGRSFLVRAIPSGEGYEQVTAHLHEFVELAALDIPQWKERLFASLACRSALRRGRELSSAEQGSLIRGLAQTKAPAVCPHGSPILLCYSRSFLIDKFSW